VVCGGRAQPGLVIDIDATLAACHSEKEGTAATYESGYGYHPMLSWLDNTGEALAGMLRPGTATANDAADHTRMIDDTLAQIPDGDRYGKPILVRAHSAGGTRGFLSHLRSLRDERGLEVSFSVGFSHQRSRRGDPAAARDGRDGRDRCHGTPRPVGLAGPACGSCAQLSVFEAHGDRRYKALATDTMAGQRAWREAATARTPGSRTLETSSRPGSAGFRPARQISQTWLQLAAANLIAWK
jgi:hypothetical protein